MRNGLGYKSRNEICWLFDDALPNFVFGLRNCLHFNGVENALLQSDHGRNARKKTSAWDSIHLTETKHNKKMREKKKKQRTRASFPMLCAISCFAITFIISIIFSQRNVKERTISCFAELLLYNIFGVRVSLQNTSASDNYTPIRSYQDSYSVYHLHTWINLLMHIELFTFLLYKCPLYWFVISLAGVPEEIPFWAPNISSSCHLKEVPPHHCRLWLARE